MDEKIKKELLILKIRRSLYIDYLKDRTNDEDWHGVQDAGSDLREIDERIRTLRDVTGWNSKT